MPAEILELEQPTNKVSLYNARNLGSCVAACEISSGSTQRAFFNVKYTIERALGTFLLMGAAPAIAVLWIVVKLTSRGPGFFIQRRVGLNGEVFGIVKLRTMCENAEPSGQPKWCVLRDSRITRVGRVMRALHLDELPQLWNVANGDMCLVGPRPERPEITKSLENLIPGYQLRHRIKPGITGLSQVNLEADRHINLTRKKQILDLRYVNEANLWLDIRILFATSLRIFGIKGNWAMKLAALKRSISNRELAAHRYQFETLEADLWNPSKGPA